MGEEKKSPPPAVETFFNSVVTTETELSCLYYAYGFHNLMKVKAKLPLCLIKQQALKIHDKSGGMAKPQKSEKSELQTSHCSEFVAYFPSFETVKVGLCNHLAVCVSTL
jgi:hypothetical protein